MVLLVVDTQKALVNDHLYLYEKFVDNIKRLISKAREKGIHMIIPVYANSTVDNDYMDNEKSYMYFNDFMWNGRYGECISVEKLIQRMDN